MAEEAAGGAHRSPGRFGTLVAGLLAGIAGGLIAPLIAPRLARGIRPASKSIFKAGIALYERGYETAAELAETASDVLAEARSEYDAEHALTDADGSRSPTSEVVRLRGGARNEVGSPDA